MLLQKKYFALMILLSVTAVKAYASTFPFGQLAESSTPALHTLRVVNQCSYPIWVHTEGRVNGIFQKSTAKLEHAKTFDYMIPDSGARATLTKAYAGCDDQGNNCRIGSDDVDTRFEVDWYSTKHGDMLVPNLSAVEGYTFPVKEDYVENKEIKTQDCGKLSLAACPNDFYDYKGGGAFDARVFRNGQIVGCYPNKKISPRDIHYNQFIQNDDYRYYGCPAGVDRLTCIQHYGADPQDSTKLSARTPVFVQYLHHYGRYQGLLDDSCKMYGYAFDDAFGSPRSDADQPITLTYCPDPKNEPAL